MTMGLFTRSGSHIDRSTGRNKRDKSPVRGSGMKRSSRGDGKVIDRARQRREQRTGWSSPANGAASKTWRW
jgi:hypothetical protein